MAMQSNRLDGASPREFVRGGAEVRRVQISTPTPQFESHKAMR